jgi:diguanylate cyclase (GGDEF)-like protein
MLLLSAFSLHAGAVEKVALQLQWKHQFEFAGFYAAKEQGFYEEAGLDVTFHQYQNRMSIVDRVLSGQTEYGVTYSSVIADYLNGADVVMLANFFKQSPLALIAQEEITSPAMLKGKTIMGVSDNIDDITLKLMLSKFGVALDDVKTLPATFNINDFIEGRVDAMSVYTTNELFSLQQQNTPYTLFDPKVYGMAFYDVNLFTSGTEIREHPDRAKRFKQASARGWRYAIEHQEEMVDLILAKYNTQNKSREALLFEAKQVSQIMLPNVYPIGSIDMNRIQAIAESFIENGFIDSDAIPPLQGLVHQDAGFDIDLTTEEQRYLERHNIIRVCADPAWMPFEGVQNGKQVGVSADYLVLVSDLLDVSFNLVESQSWNEALEFARARKCDMLALAMETPERKTYMRFTEPYIKIPLVIATRQDAPFIPDLDTVIERPLGVVKGYAFTELLKLEYPGIDLKEFDTVRQGLEALEKEAVYGFIDNLTTISYEIQHGFTSSLKISGRIDRNWELGIAVRNDDPVLFSILNKAVRSIDEKSVKDIETKWFTVKFEHQADYSTAWKVLAGIVIVVLLILYRYKESRKINAQLMELNRKLEEASVTDPLTGLYNRRYMDRRLKEEYALVQRYDNLTFSLLLMDLDDFKAINDNHGHPAGDTVLKNIAVIVQESSRVNDTVARWGGEEFLFLCPNTDLVSATQVAEKIRGTIETTCGSEAYRVSGSFGVVTYSPGKTLEWHLSSVDSALYRAKSEGKNRVVAHIEDVL